MHRSPARVCPSLALLLLAAPAAATPHEDALELEWECLHGKLELLEEAEAGRFDAETGRDHRRYPPDRLVDHRRMVLRLRFDDLNERSFSAEQTLELRGVGRPLSLLELDAVDLMIDSVERDGRPAEFFADGERLAVELDPPLAPDALTTLRIAYRCVDPEAGMIFTPSDPEHPESWPELHTQGQPEMNRHWFPCHDAPNERLATELIVDVPAGLAVSGNGRLVSCTTDEAAGRSIWHWRQERPHVNYLVSLVVGRFERVELSPAGERSTPLTVWAPPGRVQDVERTYGRTGAMLELFERRFGVPYPWDRYDQLVVRNFAAGGMENTAATTMNPEALLDETAILDGDIDGLVAHELAHQWFGDLITCRSWPHLWLNEGWATYASALWNEERFGRDGYLDSIRNSFGVADRDRTQNPAGMVSNEYGAAGENFRRAANPYSKGASILHMLRMMLGEEVFWEGVHTYVRRHQDTVVETDDLRHAFEEVSGRELEWFFAQWCLRPGTPHLTVTTRYEPAAREVVVDVVQTQAIDARTPAFRFDLPILVRTDEGDAMHVVPVSERQTTRRFPAAGPPRMIVVDPDLHVLKKMEVEAPLPLLLAQAEHGPTIAARRAALDELGDCDRPDVVALLDRVVRDEGRRHTERTQALRLLASFASPEAKERLASIIADKLPEARVRVAAIAAARSLERDQAIAVLADAARNDPSYACRAEAIEGLGVLKAKEQADLILELVDVPSHQNRIRLEALQALAELDDPRGLAKAIEASRFGNPDRARPRAIAVVGRLAEHDRENAVPFLVSLLSDPERRSVMAAGEALARLKAPEAREVVATMASNHRMASVKEAAGRWLKEMEAAN